MDDNQVIASPAGSRFPALCNGISHIFIPAARLNFSVSSSPGYLLGGIESTLTFSTSSFAALRQKQWEKSPVLQVPVTTNLTTKLQ